MTANLKVLIGKLNATSKTAVERAINYCVSRGHYEVDLEHLFLALLENTESDFALLARRFDISSSALERDFFDEMEKFKKGNSRTPVFSVHLPKLFEHAWLLASLDAQVTRIRSAHLLLALLTEPELSQLAYRGSRQFAKFSVDELKHNLAEIIGGFPEALESIGNMDRAHAASAQSGFAHADHTDTGAEVDATRQKTPALDQFTDNLTLRARQGKIDPVIGRDEEIRQVIDILARRRQNNPILTGEAGVGKTAVVEGLALRIADNDVPASLQGVALHVLDLGLLQAGASVKGEFENRLRNVIEEVKRNPHPIILFVDEAHTMIGAGGQAGQNDAANLLKPALARGELRTIAATTWSEYKKYFEKDAALARRFQVVKVEEPSESAACTMLRAVAAKMENHFNVRILDEAVIDAVRLSARYISGRQLPDKAISVLDTACARVALGQSSTPATIDDARRLDAALAQEIAVLEREASTGAAHGERLAELRTQRTANRDCLEGHEERWAREKILVEKIQGLIAQLETGGAAEGDTGGLSSVMATPNDGDIAVSASAKTRKSGKHTLQVKELAALRDELKQLQKEIPLVPVCVDAQVVGEIVSAWTGIPLGRMVKDEITTVLNLKPLLEERVIGQPHAIEEVARRVRTARANIEDPNKPKGVFLFVGPSGVGKTETALALAEALYGGERNMITINMSEYQEAHTVSGLKGSPPGYVGYGEGGVLTEAVRRKPYSVVLLDEVEKAHPDVLELFFQVFDKGVLDDAEGREVDFRNTIIILTSNVASQTIMQACLNKNANELPDAESLSESIRPQLYKAFKPAFLGRMKVIPYYPLPDAVLADIIRLKLNRIKRRVEANHKAEFICSDDVVELILARCTEVDSGARNVDHILNGTVLPEIAESVLMRISEGTPLKRVKVSVTKGGQLSYKVS
ncbi:type VI secretion system ATPase TssH [Noviherbaspirillum cavernae]|uniref:Type VI secretion system ATPase TssH n=1 Tax=Noviherbaspirillum cavernae TaxID=2320862 RepID=A0A418X0W9_9BURK|nr:type VI secretion system ATPase TssH [Noviherbaspirillum cavernae]RJG06134.1 type VI secretion system ATPase TssH [Noviherbaspirillum cavernae]